MTKKYSAPRFIHAPAEVQAPARLVWADGMPLGLFRFADGLKDAAERSTR